MSEFDRPTLHLSEGKQTTDFKPAAVTAEEPTKAEEKPKNTIKVVAPEMSITDAYASFAISPDNLSYVGKQELRDAQAANETLRR